MIRGCFTLIGGVVVVGVVAMVGLTMLASGPRSSPPATPASMGKLGETFSNGNWTVTLMDFGPWDRFSPGRQPSPTPQGRLVVADMRIQNKHTQTSNFTQSDFELRTGDGRSFKPAQWTASIDRGFVVSQTVQPGLTTENRVVFDVDPQARNLTFVALGTRWSVALP